jgi:polyhydroxyalkanoate synthesis regulator phasin
MMLQVDQLVRQGLLTEEEAFQVIDAVHEEAKEDLAIQYNVRNYLGSQARQLVHQAVVQGSLATSVGKKLVR